MFANFKYNFIWHRNRYHAHDGLQDFHLLALSEVRNPCEMEQCTLHFERKVETVKAHT